jgi:surface carbohydrate biosynthesis protein
MLKYYFKLINFLRLFVALKIIWRQPRQSDVLIFDACGQEYLLKYLSPWQPEVLHVRREQINIFVFIASLFRRGKRSDAYVDCYIQRVKPRLIVTFIDNNKSFYNLSRRHPKLKTLFIQNGLRSYYADVFEPLDKLDLNERNEYHVDYMMTLGSVIGTEYTRYITGSNVPIGSFKSNSLTKQQPKQSDTLSFVSQWYEGGFYLGHTFYSHEDYSKQVDQLVIESLAQYAKNNNKRFFIIPRYGQSENLRCREELYFQDILGDEVEFLEPNGMLSSYQAIDMSEVVVSVDSTLGYESVARGNKTAIFSIRSNIIDIPGLTYGWPKKFIDEGLFWTNTPNKDSFIRILDYLFSTDDIQWSTDVCESGFSSLMAHDPNNIIFKSIIEKELGSIPFPAFV